MKLKDLYPHPQNPRKITDERLLMLKKSLGEFGDLSGVVYNLKTKRLIGGHQRLKVLPPDTVISIDPSQPGQGYFELEGDRFVVRLVKWDETKEKAAMISANQHGGEWAYPLLPDLVAELDSMNIDMELLGFDEKELKNLMSPISGETKPVEGEDDIPEKVEAKTKPGDLYQLGNHRLMCGDSTSIDAVERLMAGSIADLVFTDPPYGVSYQSNMRTKSDRFDIIENDTTFLTEWINCLPIVSRGWVFVWTTWKVLTQWIDITAPIGAMTNVIIWDKGGGGIGDLAHTFATDYEIALVFNRGAEIAGKRLGSVWSIGKDRATEYTHPTQKPVELGVTAIENCTKRGQSVLDLFGGSGSTLIACEKTNRKCFMMEIDPHYCDVIVARWEKFTGKKAELLDGKNPKKETKVIKRRKK